MKTMEPQPQLAKQPTPPNGVKYALTIPQSVLFADLTFLAYSRENMKAALHLDYEIQYIAIDAGGAMSWNYDNDQLLNQALIREGTVHDAIKRFISDMGTTARKLLRRSEIGAATVRRSGNIEDLVQDLTDYWQAYKLHMTNLFPFWNVEQLLGNLITEELKRAGIYDNAADLERFIKPAETNQFLRERRSFERLVRRFGDAVDQPSPELLKAALHQHVQEFNFLLNPYNLSNPQDEADLLERVKQTKQELANKPEAPEADDSLDDLPYNIQQLALTARDLTFWKTERVDVLSLADTLVAPMYQAAADALGLPLNELFAMTSGEITQSLLQGKVVVSAAVRAERQKAFCLILHDGKIGFYQPSDPRDQVAADVGSELQGVGASAGVVTGPAVIVLTLTDLKQIKPGDVLVTPMTRPEYGVALDRAAAFVTNEGGLLCHAAIISREMKKPCVIATANATKVLKSGDMVEVNGTNGTVKKLD